MSILLTDSSLKLDTAVIVLKGARKGGLMLCYLIYDGMRAQVSVKVIVVLVRLSLSELFQME